MKKHILLGMSILMLLSILVLPVHAATVDMDRKGSITATMVDDGEPIPGGTLTLYRVADLDLASDPCFRYEQSYADCGIALDNLGPTTATALAVYTAENNIDGETKAINANGQVTFDNLEPGLYLLIQWKSSPDYYAVVPFLVCVPNNEDGEYVYDVDCVPKQELIPEPTCPSWPTFPTCPSEPPTEPSQPETTTPTEPEKPTTVPTEPTETPTKPTEEPTKPTEEPTTAPTTEPTKPTKPTEPTEPQLPQTGQNHWPVPVLASVGMFLLILGVIVMTREGKKNDEA